MTSEITRIQNALVRLKEMVVSYEDDEYVMEDEFDELDFFLCENLTLEYEGLLLEHWNENENLHPNWKRELLSYFAKIRTKNSIILKSFRAYWNVDPQASGLFLQDHPHPELFDACSDWIEGSAPWYKYIGSKTENSSIDHLDWVEATVAWVSYMFPERVKDFEEKSLGLKGKRLQKLLLEEVKWREAVIQKYFLSSFPEHAEEWLLTTDLSPEFRKEFCEMLEESKANPSK